MQVGLAVSAERGDRGDGERLGEQFSAFGHEVPDVGLVAVGVEIGLSVALIEPKGNPHTRPALSAKNVFPVPLAPMNSRHSLGEPGSRPALISADRRR